MWNTPIVEEPRVAGNDKDTNHVPFFHAIQIANATRKGYRQFQ
jgi:hypothetical protein